MPRATDAPQLDWRHPAGVTPNFSRLAEPEFGEESVATSLVSHVIPQALLAEPLNDVADRLERIATSLRRRSGGELPAIEPDADPLELLVTGFVLGYISRQEVGERPKRSRE